MIEMPRKCMRCSVKDCPSTTEVGLKGISMFCFPKSRDICQKWVDFCRNPSISIDAENGSLHSKNYVRICAVHFTQKSFCNSFRKKLNRGAVPTVTYNNEEADEASTSFPSPSNTHSSPNPSPVSLQLTPSHAFSSIPQLPLTSTPSHPSRSLHPAFISLDPSSNSNLSSPLLNPLPIPSTPTIVKQNRLSLSDLNITRLSELTPRKLKMYKYAKTKERQLKRLQSSITKLRSMVRSNSRSKGSVSHLHDLLNSSLSHSAAVLLGSQLKSAGKKPKGRRWTQEEKMLSLLLYRKSPKSYRLLRYLFTLPSRSTIASILHSIWQRYFWIFSDLDLATLVGYMRILVAEERWLVRYYGARIPCQVYVEIKNIYYKSFLYYSFLIIISVVEKNCKSLQLATNDN